MAERPPSSDPGSAIDALRTARLLFARELAAGSLDDAALSEPLVRAATRPRGVPSAARRLADRVRLRAGAASHASAVVPLIRARREVLGAEGDGPARVLIRVDEFPRAGTFAGSAASSAAFARFDEVIADAGAPYLLAVTPRVARDVLDHRVDEDRALDDGELAVLAALPRERVEFALHGYDHRTRVDDPRRRSEFDGLEPGPLADRLDRAAALVAALGIRTRVLVPPFNRFEAQQFGTLARHHDVVCAGPETVPVLGLRPGPGWWGDAVLLPSYPPCYGRAADMRSDLRRLVDDGSGLWIAITLHWGWESEDGFASLARVLGEIAPYVEPWPAFLAEVQWSRAAGIAA